MDIQLFKLETQCLTVQTIRLAHLQRGNTSKYELIKGMVEGGLVSFFRV